MPDFIDMTQSVTTMELFEKVINSLLAKPCGENDKIYRVFLKSIPGHNSEIWDTLLSICSNLTPLDRQNMRLKGGLSVDNHGLILLLYHYGRRKEDSLPSDVNTALYIVTE